MCPLYSFSTSIHCHVCAAKAFFWLNYSSSWAASIHRQWPVSNLHRQFLAWAISPVQGSATYELCTSASIWWADLSCQQSDCNVSPLHDRRSTLVMAGLASLDWVLLQSFVSLVTLWKSKRSSATVSLCCWRWYCCSREILKHHRSMGYRVVRKHHQGTGYPWEGRVVPHCLTQLSTTANML